MPDGSKWDVPAQIIAENRARYYAKHDSKSDLDPHGQKKGDEPYDSIYESELLCGMDDDAELMDWAANNINWSDVEKFASLAEAAKPPNYQYGWVNGNKEVVSK